MEDDDEFGDLYTDVITSFPGVSSSFQSLQHPSQSESAPPPIDNAPAAATTTTLPSEVGDVLFAPSSSTPHSNFNINLNPKPNLNLPPKLQANENSFSPSRVSQDPPLLESHEFREVSANSPSGAAQVETAKTRVLESRDFNLNTEAAVTDHEFDRKLDQSTSFIDAGNRGVQFDQEDDGPVIPGISMAGALNANVVSQEQNNDQGDDWESDSDDDLQIVLNENGHPDDIHQYQGQAMMAKAEEGDDEDEDGEPLVIVSPPEEQGWGDEVGQAPDGERKELSEAGKANGGASLPPKVGFNNFGYNQYHSQFKYVRPGATPLPGGPGGVGQLRPPINMGSVGGRGRGDWRQAGMKGSLQKGFQSGFWGSNASGRGSGGDFILPSHKTIFDINIDSFEEKPWSHPGADVSDFFNFELNEDSWKDYCKKLEHLRMESTMKSKAHVLVVGSQQEQEYDPDLPPELAAAAAAIQETAAENSNALRADVGLSDIGKGTALLRPPPLPIGRPIQVDAGSGERVPSMDMARPPRMRDLDTVIEIVLQGSVDDATSAGCGAIDQPNNDASREDLRDDAVEEDGEQTGNEYSDESPQSLDRTKREVNPRRPPRVNASHGNIPEDGSSLPPESPSEHSPGSRENSPIYPSDKFEASHKESRMEGKAHERSRSTSPGESAQGGRFVDEKQEESSESMERKDSPHDLSFEERVISDDEPIETEENNQKEKDGVNLGTDVSSNPLDISKHHSVRKPGSQVEHNSKATGSSRDFLKGHNVVDNGGIQHEHSSHARDLKRNRREDVQSQHRKDRDGSLETEKNNMLAKRREGSYLHRDSVPYSPHSSHVEGFDRRRERDYADAMLQQRGEDPHTRTYRAAEMMARQRGKVREAERSNKDEYLPSRKLLDSGNWRGQHEKDVGFRTKEKDDILKTGFENMDDPHSKRRKDGEHARRDQLEKGEILRAHRDNNSHRKRERDESLVQRKRDDLRRRENIDDHRSIIRSKDVNWLQRERVEQRHRERDDGPRTKQSFLESSSRREREDGRAPIKIGRNVEDKGRRKDEYKGYDRDGSYKDTGRNSEQLKRKDKVEDASTLHNGFEEKRLRQEKPTGRSDRAVHASDNQNVHGRRPKENSRKSKQSEGGQQSTSNSSKKPREEKGGRNEMADLIGTTEEGNAECGNSVQLQTTQEKMEDGSDDEQHRSKRGRSKLERWASHEERDSSIKSKPSSSLKVEAEKDNPDAELSPKVSDDPAKKSQADDNSHSAVEGIENGVPKEKEADTKQMENRHLDTVAKLKKRSERFKLPMPSEKDTTTTKKMEGEPLSSAPTEALADEEMKQVRPPRKRRWISN